MKALEEYADTEEFLLAATLWGEARGESVQGMRAVAHVIMNRVKAKKSTFGLGVEGVVKKDKQFSCWNKGSATCAKLNHQFLDRLIPGSPDEKAWIVARAVAINVISGKDPDPTHGALYYHTKTVDLIWDNNLRKVYEVGSHIFFV